MEDNILKQKENDTDSISRMFETFQDPKDRQNIKTVFEGVIAGYRIAKGEHHG